MQRERTIEAVQKEDERRDTEINRLQQAIEIYDETTLDRRVDGGQGWCQSGLGIP
jgi:hypothetical protein